MKKKDAIKWKKNKLITLKENIKVLRRLLYFAEGEALSLLREVEPTKLGVKAVWSRIGDWDCENPLGLCVYDNIEDKIHDDCLFCHDSEERK